MELCFCKRWRDFVFYYLNSCFITDDFFSFFDCTNSSNIKLDIRRIGAVKEGEEVIGNETRVKVVKNKVSPPFTKAEFQILYGKGINVEGEIIDFGQKLGLIEKACFLNET